MRVEEVVGEELGNCVAKISRGAAMARASGLRDDEQVGRAGVVLHDAIAPLQDTLRGAKTELGLRKEGDEDGSRVRPILLLADGDGDAELFSGDVAESHASARPACALAHPSHAEERKRRPCLGSLGGHGLERGGERFVLVLVFAERDEILF